MVCFLIVSPILVLYSMGDRFDFIKMKITQTGGIYVRTFPVAEQITIDSKISKKPALFSNSIFVQSLLPNIHTVLIKKSGYYDYNKSLPVQEEQVTKLENVILFKKNIQFESIADATQSPFNTQKKFIIKNNNLYYSDAPENSGLTIAQKSTPILKKISTFTKQNNIIIWLGTDGFLYKSTFNATPTAEPIKIILTPLKLVKNGTYKIIADDKNIFINDNNALLIFNNETKSLDNFADKITDAKISPDGKNIVYYDNQYIYVSTVSVKPVKSIIYKSPDDIKNCVWLNNDYIIFLAGNNIIISEIDYRGNINYITLPTTITIHDPLASPQPQNKIPDAVIELKNPQIFFNQQEGKLYILNNKALIASERILP